ncbi:MAG: DUF2939 domain-containing protein [Fluviicoccus sp.]|uniref:DUF2939 domain-containing protein n=1 Tax=Fluviicoccus sp. TaxID=2003552 RepID=UPI0027229CBF|nr:DUF2939 domain-containing protein [Fluviicoccus sp.]MDO8329389.1 DUF2939 domain-containing protein [Fluviicoccus sp.]
MKKILIPALLFAAVGGGWIYQTPYRAIERMETAIHDRNTEQLNRRIDYPKVRSSLKASLGAGLSTSLLGRQSDSGMQAFANMFAAAMLNPMIDALVTPEGLELLLQADIPDPKSSAKPDAASPDKTIAINKHYDGINRFVMTVSRQTVPTVTVNFIFERESLTDWILREITIPDSPVNSPAS